MHYLDDRYTGRRPSPEEMNDFRNRNDSEPLDPVSIAVWTFFLGLVVLGYIAIYFWAFGNDAYPAACDGYRAECAAASEPRF